jgi:hypothetical protein
LLVDRIGFMKRPRRRRQITEVMIEIGHALEKPRPGRRAETKRRIDQNGTHGWRVASPIQEHLLPGAIFSATNTKVPDRRKIGWPESIILRHAGHEIFRQIHGIVAARSPMRLRLAVPDIALHPGKLFLLLEQRLPGERNQQVAINLPIDERETAIAVIIRVHESDLVHDNVRIEARIVRGFEQEPQHALHIVGVTRTRGDDVRHFILAQAVSRGVTDGAVVRDTRETDNLF